MVLIAESGSTKTTWIGILNSKQKLNFTSSGFNPYIQKREQIKEIIKEEVVPYLKDTTVSHLFFYGAGCSNDVNKSLMKSCFRDFLNKATIEVEHDLIAAARALWQGETGIVSILGTGSNSCVFDGNEIIENVPSLGYILGDEGSGAYMGRILLRDFVYLKVPGIIANKLREEYQLSPEKILDKVYKKPNPNRWLASFSIFIRDNIDEAYCQGLVRQSFHDFFDRQISNYNHFRDLPFGAIGSIAFHYKDYLEETCKEFGFKLAKIIKSPMDGLVKYHNIPAAIPRND